MATKIVANCTTGTVTLEPLTEAEERERQDLERVSLQHANARKSALARREADLAALKAYAAEPGAHPAWALVARLLGGL